MNDTRAGLEAALAANPDDVATHAAYADCLIEQGDPRGDYVRLQLALEDRDQPVERLRAMEQEAFELRQRHEAEWLGPLADHVNPAAGMARRDVNIEVLEANVQVTYRRGWLDTMRVRRLTPAVAAALATCPIAGLLAELEVTSSRLADLMLIPLTNLVRLRWDEEDEFELSLSEPQEPPAGWFHSVTPAFFPPAPAFSARVMPRLRELTLRMFRGDDGVGFLVRCGVLGQLRGLDLCRCGITDDGAQILAADPAVPRLDYLNLDDNHISPIGIDALATVGVEISQRQYLGPTPGGEPAEDAEGIDF